MTKWRKSIERKIHFLFRTDCFTELSCAVLMLYRTKKGKGQQCLELENEGFEVLFGGYCIKKRHISENTQCIALKFSDYIAKTYEKLNIILRRSNPYFRSSGTFQKMF